MTRAELKTVLDENGFLLIARGVHPPGSAIRTEADNKVLQVCKGGRKRMILLVPDDQDTHYVAYIAPVEE